MGRKIPGRKHRGVRDPEKQRAEKLKILKNKVNVPPTNPDDQPIPRSLSKIVELKNKTKENGFKRKRRPAKSKRPVVFEPIPGEKDKQFLNRINRICEEVKKETAFEVKYGVKIKRNPQTGEVEEIAKRPKDEVELIMQEVRNNKKMKHKKNKVTTSEVKLTKSQKRQKKLKEKKLKKLENNAEMDFPSREFVKFGEIVHAPPSLPTPRKAKTDNSAPKLLLESLLHKNQEKNIPENKSKTPQIMKKQIQNKVIDRKGKRKDLPNALRRQLDREQKEVIEAYKKMKKEKHK